MTIEVYADGSGNTFNSDGGYGWRLLVDGEVHSDGSGYISSSTNNSAELTAAIEGLKAAEQYLGLPEVQSTGPHTVVLVCDSQLVLGYANGAYKCKALHLTQLYISLKKVFTSCGASTRWVKGHSGDPNNEAVDKLAGAARKSKGVTNGKEENSKTK
jgi:ribonuclease HI